MQNNHFLLLKKLKNTERAQLCSASNTNPENCNYVRLMASHAFETGSGLWRVGLKKSSLAQTNSDTVSSSYRQFLQASILTKFFFYKKPD